MAKSMGLLPDDEPVEIELEVMEGMDWGNDKLFFITGKCKTIWISKTIIK